MKDLPSLQVPSSTPSPNPSLRSCPEPSLGTSGAPTSLQSSSPSTCPMPDSHHLPSPGARPDQMPSLTSSVSLLQGSNPSYQLSSSKPNPSPFLTRTQNPSLISRASHSSIDVFQCRPPPQPHISYVPVDFQTGGKTLSQVTVPLNSSPHSSGSEASNSKKRRSTSIVWTEFEKRMIDGRQYAICNTCNSKLTAGRNGTRHLHSHMERCKRVKTMGHRQKRQQTKKGNEIGKGEPRNCSFDQEASRRDIVNAIILHGYPLNMVNHYGFQKFIKGLQPMFQMVSRSTIRKDIFRIYDVERDKIISLLEKLDCRIAVSVNVLTAKSTEKSYMAITAHFITEAWCLRSHVVRFIYIPHPDNAEVLAEYLMDALLGLSIDRKLSTITLDNGTGSSAMLASITEKLDGSSLMLDGSVSHLHCFANMLNLMVKDGLEVISGVIEKVRNGVNFWTASPQKLDEFKEACRQLCLPYTKKLCLDVGAHWNSTHLMLQTATLYKDVFLYLRPQDPYDTSLPSEHDWELVKEITGKLQMFRHMMELFCGSSCRTLNCYFPKICEIQVAISKWIDDPLEIVRVMASQMMERFEKYWSACHHIIGIASVLDPRYKMMLVEYFFNIIYGDKAPVYVSNVRHSCYALQHEYQFKAGRNHNVGISSACSPVAVEGNEDDLLSRYDLFVASNAYVKSEMDLYLEECVLPRTADFDILSWWKTNGVKFPTLQKVALDILAIPASAAASKSAFTNNRAFSSHQRRLHHTTMEALICTQNWLSDEVNATCSSQTPLLKSTFYEDEDEDEDEEDDEDEDDEDGDEENNREDS